MSPLGQALFQCLGHSGKWTESAPLNFVLSAASWVTGSLCTINCPRICFSH